MCALLPFSLSERPRSMARGQEIIHAARLHRESIASVGSMLARQITPHPAIERSLSADSKTHQKDHQQREADQQANHPARARSSPKVERPAHPRDRLRNPYSAVSFAEVQPNGPVVGVSPLSVVEFSLIHFARPSSNVGDQQLAIKVLSTPPDFIASLLQRLVLPAWFPFLGLPRERAFESWR